MAQVKLRRLAAFYIDMFLFMLVYYGGMLLIFGVDFMRLASSMFRNPMFYFFTMLAMIAFCVVRDLPGRSLGKVITQLRIEQTDGTPVPRYKLALRNLSSMIWPVEAVTILARKDGQKMLDRAMGLQVVPVWASQTNYNNSQFHG